TGPLDHQLTMGVEYNRLDNRMLRQINTGFTLDPYQPDFNRPIPRENAWRGDFHTHDKSRHIYLHDSIQVVDNLSLILGLRHSNFSTDHRLTGRTSSEHTVLSHLAGLTWQAHDR